MAKKINPKNNHRNQTNANKGTSGVNKQYAKAQSNRDKQISQHKKSTK